MFISFVSTTLLLTVVFAVGLFLCAMLPQRPQRYRVRRTQRVDTIGIWEWLVEGWRQLQCHYHFLWAIKNGWPTVSPASHPVYLYHWQQYVLLRSRQNFKITKVVEQLWSSPSFAHQHSDNLTKDIVVTAYNSTKQDRHKRVFKKRNKAVFKNILQNVPRNL